MIEFDESAIPAWGTLPVEQYLIRKWDYSSELSVDDQRAELVAAYIEEDVLDPELLASPPTRVPTAAEIADILEPWRPQKLRRIAAAHLLNHWSPWFVLRTHYGGGEADDTKLRTWLDAEGDFADDPAIVSPGHEWFCVLDDPELFDFGDYWQEVYDVFPELAAPRADRRFTDDDVKEAREEGKYWITHGSEWDCMTDDERYQEAIMQRAVDKYGAALLLVLDKDALDAGECGLILRDKKGHPVKESEIDPGGLQEFIARSERGMFFEGHWEHGRPGYKYRLHGKIMRKLLPLVKGEA